MPIVRINTKVDLENVPTKERVIIDERGNEVT